jgi:hypothetical protein
LEGIEGQREIPELFPALRKLGSFYTYRGELEKGAEVGRQIPLLADAQDDPSMHIEGHLVLGSCLGFAT